LQTLLDINFAQTEKKLAEQLGIMQQPLPLPLPVTISVRLHTMEKVQKEDRWVPHELSEDKKNRWRDTALTLLLKFRKKIFSAQNHYRR